MGAAPDPVVAAARQDHGVGVDQIALTRVLVEAVGAEDRAVVVREHPGDVDVLEDRHARLLRAAHECLLDLEPGVVAGEGGAPPRVGAEEALGDPAVLLAGELHAEAVQVLDPAGGALRDDLDGARVGQPIALLERVRGVLLPGVLRIECAQRCVDAACRERGVGVVAGPLPDCEDVDSLLAQLDRRPQSGSSRPTTRTEVEIWRSRGWVCVVVSVMGSLPERVVRGAAGWCAARWTRRYGRTLHIRQEGSPKSLVDLSHCLDVR